MEIMKQSSSIEEEPQKKRPAKMYEERKERKEYQLRKS